jgi:hypothetical protein
MTVTIDSWTKNTQQQKKEMIQHSATRKNSLRGSATRGRAESLTGQGGLSHTGKIISYCKLRLAKLKVHRTSSKTPALRRRDADIPKHPPLNADEVREKILSSRKYLSEVQSNHQDIRTTHLE